MLDNAFWLEISNYISEKWKNALSETDKRVLANQYEGSWVASKLSKKLDTKLVDLMEELNADMLQYNSNAAKNFVDKITSACEEVGIV